MSSLGVNRMLAVFEVRNVLLKWTCGDHSVGLWIEWLHLSSFHTEYATERDIDLRGAA